MDGRGKINLVTNTAFEGWRGFLYKKKNKTAQQKASVLHNKKLPAHTPHVKPCTTADGMNMMYRSRFSAKTIATMTPVTTESSGRESWPPIVAWCMRVAESAPVGPTIL
jgi:hypothetical protein